MRPPQSRAALTDTQLHAAAGVLLDGLRQVVPRIATYRGQAFQLTLLQGTPPAAAQPALT